MSNKCDSLKNAIIIEKKSESNFFLRKNVIPQLQIVEFGSCKSERKNAEFQNLEIVTWFLTKKCGWIIYCYESLEKVFYTYCCHA